VIFLLFNVGILDIVSWHHRRR